ncbi:MAG: glycosyltransferase family 4 protein [Bacteroidia bacterium]|nr:glycosyltransferase family 4 protein [Bacteroidia bacterium]
MKIVLLADGVYPHAVGGIQRHTALMCQYLLQAGVEVSLYHPHTDLQGPVLAETGHGFRETAIPFPAPMRIPGHYIYANWLYAKSLAAAVRRQDADADLIYAQGFTGWAWAADTRPADSPPLWVNLHGLEMYQYAANRRERLIQRLLRIPADTLLRRASYLQSLGGKLTDILRERGVTEDRIRVLPIGVSSDWLIPETSMRAPHQPRRLVFIGRYERRKGLPELQQVLIRLQAAGVPFQIDIIGDVPPEVRLQADAVRYHGLIRDTAYIQQVLRAADILVSPSYAEGMPTVILEAMACGCAVVATDVGAVRELITPETGWLIPPGDTDALEAAIRAAIQTPDDILRTRQVQGRTLVEKQYRWETVASQMIRTFREVVPNGQMINLPVS